MERLFASNFTAAHSYAEPYAGGASLALSLLRTNKVSEIFLNDLDTSVYAFWWSILTRTDDFLRLLRKRTVTVEEWGRQRSTYANPRGASRLSLGFSFFFLNRTNHSGIMNGGIIGGKAQRGEWLIDARFNKPELERRILAIAQLRHRIQISNLDALDFLRTRRFGRNTLVYCDPPYYRRGPLLYLNSYTSQDHALVHQALTASRMRWLVSYDDVPEIRRLYSSCRSRRFKLLHTARDTRVGKEVMYFSPDLKVPRLPSSSIAFSREST